MAKTYTQIGTMLQGENGPFIALGNKGGNAKYNFDIDIRVTLPDGTKKTFKNGFISLQDPRKRKGANPEKIPATILNNLVIVTEE